MLIYLVDESSKQEVEYQYSFTHLFTRMEVDEGTDRKGKNRKKKKEKIVMSVGNLHIKEFFSRVESESWKLPSAIPYPLPSLFIAHSPPS